MQNKINGTTGNARLMSLTEQTYTNAAEKSQVSFAKQPTTEMLNSVMGPF